MAEFPGFTIWTDAYLSDTHDLSTLEHGAYLLLLMKMWRAGGYLPNDEVKLARAAGLARRDWDRIRGHLMPFFRVENGMLTQGRLQDELHRARSRSQKAAESARAKYRKNNDVVPANADPKQCLEPASITITIDNTSSLRSDVSASAKNGAKKELLLVLDEEHAAAVIEHRRKLRKPLTERAAKLLAGKFSKCADPNNAADAMIANGWQGFEPEWLRAGGNGRAPPAPQESEYWQRQRQLTAEAERRSGHGNGIDGGGSQPNLDLGPGDYTVRRRAAAGD